MSFKHSVSCGRCGAEALACQLSGGADARWFPPRGWLSISYAVVGENGAYVVDENRHACADCAKGVIDALGKATSSSTETR